VRKNMNERKTPDWLIETQNKSWEPEILISGITLTFLFIISSHIYNFYGMLTQDFGVYDGITKMSYSISVSTFVGLKMILLSHLILRGIWTGFVGLSYVYPRGVNKQKIRKEDRNIDFDTPEEYVIKIEKICSLLFSFIFSSITFIIGIFIVFIPITILFLFGLNMVYIHYFSLALAAIIVIISLIMTVFRGRLKNSKIEFFMANSIFNNALVIYLSNIGRVKAYTMFISFILIVVALSFPDISRFDFDNEKIAEISTTADIVSLDNNHYEALRNQELRISKATIDRFRVIDDSVELFISFYKEDIYTIKELEHDPESAQKFGVGSDSTKISLPDLYKVTIDDRLIAGLKWYSVDNIGTGQKGIMTKIPLRTLKHGYHELKIDKIFWKISKKKMKRIVSWGAIPFETEISSGNTGH
jgi:hypothetical protein